MSRTSPNKVLYKPPFDTDRDDVLSMIKQGWSDSKIAHHVGVTKDTIWCRRARWGFPSGSEMRNSKLISDITILWENCYSAEEIANVLGLSTCIVYLKMREHNIRSVPRLGLNIREVSTSELGREITEDATQDEKLLITYRQQPRFVLVPIDEYIERRDMNNGHAN
jgi:hypothetical protein